MRGKSKGYSQSRRSVCLVMAIVAELFVFVVSIHFLCYYMPFLKHLIEIVAFVLVIFLLNTAKEPAFKICWLLLILPFPVVGTCLFLRLGGFGPSRKTKKSLEYMEMRRCEGLLLQEASLRSGVDFHSEAEMQLRYFEKEICMPAYGNTRTEYFSAGEILFFQMKKQLKKAKKYIFLQYFIIKNGCFWGEILDILREKQKSGVEVRILYDDVGCLFFLPEDFAKKMEYFGIRAVCVHPLRLLVSHKCNQRDHRKLMIIDGTVAFTGGVNLSDEYVNMGSRFGDWKDSAILLEGAAVWSVTLMFLTMWEYVTGDEEKFSCFLPEKPPFFQVTSVVLPYTEIPLNTEPVAQRVFLNMMTQAKKYIYMTSPYLILDTTTETVLCNMAKMGVDVKIMTPAVPDKKMVFQVTRGQYEPLIRAGVKIYEYKPGFLHGKIVVVDGKFATVGTVNLDYRSLFLHFENGVWLYGDDAISEIEADFCEILGQSAAYTFEEEKYGTLKKVLRSILKVFSPLM